MTKRMNWENVNSGKRQATQGVGYISDELPPIGSFADMQRFSKVKKMGPYSTVKNFNKNRKRTSSPDNSIIVRKGGALRKERNNKKPTKPVRKAARCIKKPDEKNSNEQPLCKVKSLEEKLDNLARLINNVNVEKSGADKCRSLMVELIKLSNELITIAPHKKNAQLSPGLMAAFEKLKPHI